MAANFNYKHISPSILELCWPPSIQADTLLEMQAVKTNILQAWQDQLLDVTMGYHCLSLHFREAFRLNEVINELESIAKDQPDRASLKRKRWTIPVVYDGKDLGRAEKLTGLSREEIIQIHQNATYLLYFYGFMPGFMYLGGLDKRIFVPRKAQPDKLIESGSVAIGGKQTGIYPMNSPGGWNVIGRTPVKLFDVENDPPLRPFPADEVKFQAIDASTYQQLLTEVHNQTYQLHYENL